MGAVELATKTCTRCKAEKPLTDFHRQATSRDGRTPRCKECNRTVSRAWMERKRSEMGEEAWLDYRAEQVRRYRKRHQGEETPDKLSRDAYRAAEVALRQAHQEHFDALLRHERYERGLD